MIGRFLLRFGGIVILLLSPLVVTVVWILPPHIGSYREEWSSFWLAWRTRWKEISHD